MAKKFSGMGSRQVALGGILAAGSLALLWLTCLAPSGRMGFTAVAGLFPMVGVLASGRAVGYLCWAAAGILGLFLLPDKGVALLYLVFLGLYPVVKSRIESLRCLPLEWCLKLLSFNLALSLAWFAFRGLVLPAFPSWVGDNALPLYLAGNLVFAAYDIGLSQLASAMQTRLFSHTHHKY